MSKFVLLATAASLALLPALPAHAAPADPAPAAAPAADEPQSLSNDDVVVTGQKPVSEASSGTKTDTPIAETPQSISVITSNDIAALGLQNLNQALRFVAGVTPEQRGSSAEVYDQFKLRGFDAPQFLDGLRLIGGGFYLSPQVDVSRLDRIEVLKGPSGALYGQSGPGGLVALSSKLPLDRDLYGAVAGSYGNYDLYRVDADVGGRLSSDVLWRVYGSANGADTQQRFGRRERQTVSGAVTIGAGRPTSLTLLAAYSHDPRNGTYGVFPASGTFIDNPNGKLSTKFDGGEPGNFFKREQAALTYLFRHDFGGGWSFRANGRYQYASSRLGLVYVGGPLLDPTDPAQQVFRRSSYSSDEELNAWTFDNQLVGRVTTGPVTHDLLIGVDRQVGRTQVEAAFSDFSNPLAVPPLNAYFPVYNQPGAYVPQYPDEVQSGFPFSSPGRLRQQGVYVQDQIAWEGLRVVLSGRQDWARSGSPGARQSDRKFTYRTAALYKFDFGLAPYVSYSTNFLPQLGTITRPDGTVTQPEPLTGNQIEAGAKLQVPGTNILVTAAWFQIKQNNMIAPGPVPNTSIQGGAVRTRGVEVEASAQLPYDFTGRLAFSRQRFRSLSGENEAVLLGTGRGGVSANLEWAPKDGALAGFAIGGAVRHVSSVDAGTYFDGINPVGTAYRTNPYTLFDALVRVDISRLLGGPDGVTLGVNAQNVFDKKHISTCYLTYSWCWYGNRRTVQGTLSWSF